MLMQSLLQNKQFTKYLQKIPAKNPRSMFMNPTDVNEIKQIMQFLQSKKSYGHDNLSPHQFKLIAEQISLPVAILINKSLSESIVTDEIKIAKIILVYKSKAKFFFSNYKPISLLPTILKILDMVVHGRSYDYDYTKITCSEY